MLPIPDDLVEMARGFDLVLTVEDGLVENGVGAALREAIVAAGIEVPVQTHGIPTAFLSHASRAEIVEDLGLRAADVARDAAAVVAAKIDTHQ